MSCNSQLVSVLVSLCEGDSRGDRWPRKEGQGRRGTYFMAVFLFSIWERTHEERDHAPQASAEVGQNCGLNQESCDGEHPVVNAVHLLKAEDQARRFPEPKQAEQRNELEQPLVACKGRRVSHGIRGVHPLPPPICIESSPAGYSSKAMVAMNS